MVEFLYGDITGAIIEAAGQVLRQLGPGLEEAAYEQALALELQSRGFRVERQVGVRPRYRGRLLPLVSIDLVVEGKVTVELKVIQGRIQEAHKNQLRAAMRASGRYAVGLVLNFGRTRLGIQRVYVAENDPTAGTGRR